ncbi:MAG: LemA family protein [Candidatus Izemoplasmatales bacterium]|nr:LemA family protein [Candidatus Izemoplasmatales bacterium]MDY0138484.1 LemA family protein [Candidatus Izemoplasmatales bacterium]
MKIKVLAIVGVVVAVFSIITIFSYNHLVNMDEDVSLYYSQIDNRLQERHDKIGQILAVVNGLQEHAETIYNAITAARTAYAEAKAANDIEGMIEADALEAVAFTDVLIAIEDNPLITAESGFQSLIYEISGMESALSQARKDYNEAVADYNRGVRKFPSVIFANLFGFESERDYWKMNEGADEVPEIDFGD